jgi:hypothetical protein
MHDRELLFRNNGNMGIVGTHSCATMTLDHIGARMVFGAIMTSEQQ